MQLAFGQICWGIRITSPTLIETDRVEGAEHSMLYTYVVARAPKVWHKSRRRSKSLKKFKIFTPKLDEGQNLVRLAPAQRW